MRHLTAADIQAFEKIYRLNLVNGLPGFKPANLVGTAAPDGATNLAVFSSALHLGSDPALLGIVTRPTTVPRHTYANLKSSGCYTLNHVPVALAASAHYTSANFPDSVSEFDECGFTAVFRDDFPAPYVAESPLSIGLRLLEEHHISNGTVLLVGTVEHVYLAEEGLREDGTRPGGAGHGLHLGPRWLPRRGAAGALRLRPAGTAAGGAVILQLLPAFFNAKSPLPKWQRAFCF